MDVFGSPQTSIVLNVMESSAAIAVGVPSVSLTCAACTVTVQDSLEAKLASGLSVNVLGPPVTDTAWAPLLLHRMENAPASTVTSSLNVTVMFAVSATCAAPLDGVVPEIDGAESTGAPHGPTGDDVFRGEGAAAVKSAAL